MQAKCVAVIKQVKYSAAWLASRKLLESFSASFLTEERLQRRGTMMEGASFLVFGGAQAQGSHVFKSSDLLDFYVEHLSWYERLLARAAKEIGEGRERVQRFARWVYRSRIKEETAKLTQLSGAHRNRRVVAVMPFYAASGGQGPSATEMRASYLNATLASIRSSLTERIVVAVENLADLNTAREHGPLFDEFYLPGLVSPDKLGVAALIATHRALMRLPLNHSFFGKGHWTHDNRWADVDYVFYTESDQIVRIADQPALLEFADATGGVVVPRRVVPIPISADFDRARCTRAIDYGGGDTCRMKRELLATTDFQTNDAIRVSDIPPAGSCCSCCFPGERADACKQVQLQVRSTSIFAYFLP